MKLHPIPLGLSRAGLLTEKEPAAPRNVFMTADHLEDMLAHASACFALQLQKQDRVSVSANAMRDMLDELMTGEVSTINGAPVMRMPDGFMTREYGEWVPIVPALDGWVDCMQRITPGLSSEAISNLGRLLGAGDEITPELVMVARLQLEDQISAMKRLPISTINASVESTQADWRAEQQLKEETEAMNARDKANDPKAINAAHGLLMAATDALSADNVAAMLKITKKAATLQLKKLQGLGLLESEPRKGGVPHYRLIAAPASNTPTVGDVDGKTDAAIDWTAPEMQYLAPEDYELPPADPVLLASANRMLSDRLERVAHVLRGNVIPELALAKVMGIAERLDINQEVSSLLGIIADTGTTGDPAQNVLQPDGRL